MKIFLSYSWANKDEADAIDQYLSQFQLTVIRDVRDLKPLGHIRTFMESIKEANFAILLISDPYIKSKNCLYEVIQLLNSDNYLDKIIPVILDNIKMSSATEQIKYVSYWETQIKELESKIRNDLDSVSYIHGILSELEHIKEIRNKIDLFFKHLTDYLYFIYKELEVSKFKEIGLRFGVEKIPQIKELKPIVKLKNLSAKIPIIEVDDIIGREKELNELHNLFNNQKKAIAINGLGGLGKTTLAQAYLSKFYDYYEHIVWIDQSSDDLIKDFIGENTLINNLKITVVDLNPEQLFNEIQRKLNEIKEKPNLIIIDNTEKKSKIHLDYLPQHPNWHLLVTSREKIPEFCAKSIGFLNEDQAVELFKKHYSYNKLHEHDIRDLLATIDYHTLTIEILAKTAAIFQYDIATLQNAINKNLESSIGVPHNNYTEDFGNIISYLGKVFPLSKLNHDEIWVMKQFVCLPNEFLSHELLLDLLLGGLMERNSIIKALALLERKGWLIKGKSDASYKSHLIISEVIKNQTFIALSDIHQLLLSIVNKLDFNQDVDNPIDKFIWIPFAKKILLILLDHSSPLIILLQNNLGVVLREYGNFQEAKMLFENVVNFNINLLGEKHLDMINMYNNLALTLHYLSLDADAKTLLEKNIEIATTNYGSNSAFLINIYSNISSVLRSLGFLQEAMEFNKKAIELSKIHLTENRAVTARLYSNLAMLLQSLGEYSQAKTFIQKAMNIDEQTLGANHPIMAVRYSNMATVLQNLNQYDDALILMNKAVEVAEINFGNEHFTTTLNYSNLATIYRDIGQLNKAKELMERVIGVSEKNFGHFHPNTALFIGNLGSVHQKLRNFNKAKELIEQSKKIYKKIYGEDHRETVKSSFDLAYLYKDFQKYNKAKELFAILTPKMEVVFGEKHHQTINCYFHFGELLFLFKDYRGAGELFEKTVAYDERNYGVDHKRTGMSYFRLALVLFQLKDLKGALNFSEKALPIFITSNHPDLYDLKFLMYQIRLNFN